MKKTYKEIVADAKTRVREISAEEVRAMPDATIIDVREDCEWREGHLPGAMHLSRGVLESRIEKALPDRDAPIVCYCGGGGRSTLSADALQEMGYTNVRSLAGGFRGWAAAGNPTETE
jgi:rhodanese-related sulfurtransferase